jgi:DNA-binding FrmR family transcriptional regulator
MKEIERKKVLMMLKRIQGQVGGIIKMLENGKECEDLLTQLSAAMNSLKTVARTLLSQEAEECIGNNKRPDKYAELLKRFF